MNDPLILASRSPQRSAILTQLGVAFETRPADVEETETGAPETAALDNARRKAEAVAAGAPGRTVLGADTVVALGGRMYGKPGTGEEARATLSALAGETHAVLTGLCVIEPGGDGRLTVARTLVRFREADPAILRWYLESEEWRERAGGYAVQGRGAALVAAIEGDYTNVVGLPVPALLDLVPGLVTRFRAGSTTGRSR